MVTKIPLTRARVNLGQLVKRVHLGKESFVLEKDGYPVAALVDIDEFEDYLELNDPETKKQITLSAADYHVARFRPAERFLAELKVKPGKSRRSRRHVV